MNAKVRLACLLLIGWLALAVRASGAVPQGRAWLGVYAGRSLSLGTTFIDMTSGGHTDNHYLPNFFLGAHFQYNFSRVFGLQLSVNYQNCSNDWDFHYWNRTEEGRESIGAFSLSLNGIVALHSTALSRFYLLAGAGFLSGSFQNLGVLFQLAGGFGARLYMKRGSPHAFHLAALLHPVFYKYGDKNLHPLYLKLQAGFEARIGKPSGTGLKIND
jgi:hypothetical protein